MKKANIIIKHYGRFKGSYKVGNGSCSDVLQSLGYLVTKKGRSYDYVQPPQSVNKGEKLIVAVDILEKEEVLCLANKLFLNDKPDAGKVLCWPYFFEPADNKHSSATVFKFGGGQKPTINTETINVSHDARFKIGAFGLWEASVRWKGSEILFYEDIKAANR